MTKSELVSQHFYHWAELKHIVPHTVQDQLQKHICNTDMLRGAEEIGIEDPLRQPGRRIKSSGKFPRKRSFARE